MGMHAANDGPFLLWKWQHERELNGFSSAQGISSVCSNCQHRGAASTIGRHSQLHSSLYSNIKQLHTWDPSQTSEHTHHGGIFNFDYAPDGSILVAACERRSLLMFDPCTAKLIGHKNQAHGDCVNYIRFLDSRVFCTCSDDTTIALWDTRYMKNKIRTLLGHTNWVKNIEYASDVGLLVTSGFDGKIYTWDINRYSEKEMQYEVVFHTNGLMRSKLTPDNSKLIISTAGGFLVVIHDLDLYTLKQDLHGFKPDIYRLMQLSNTPMGMSLMYNPVFEAKRNRVELISDFPVECDPEMISSLQVHPHGWCVVSRHTSRDESSEWTCVHDIQYPLAGADLTSATESSNEIKNDCFQNENSGSSALPIARFSPAVDGVNQADDSPFPGMRLISEFQLRRRRSQSDNEGADDIYDEDNDDNEDSDDIEDVDDDDEHGISGEGTYNLQVFGELSSESNSRETAATENSDRDERFGGFQIERIANSIVDTTQLLSQSNSVSADAETSTHDDGTESRPVTLVLRNGDAEVTVFHVNRNRIRGGDREKIRKNNKRLLCYSEETNQGRGFIKELAFSADGRVVSSPFGFGIRLLAFNPCCDELSDCVPDAPVKMFETACNMCHSNVVVTTKFSPVSHQFVAGCLSGKVTFHQPVF